MSVAWLFASFVVKSAIFSLFATKLCSAKNSLKLKIPLIANGAHALNMNFLILLLISGILADLREKIIEHLNDPVLLNSIAGKDRSLSSSIKFSHSKDFLRQVGIESFILKLVLKTSNARKKLTFRSFTGEVRKQVDKIRDFNPKA